MRRVAAAFLVSCGPILRPVTKAPVQTIVRLILSLALALALAPALAHSGEMKPQFDHEKHQGVSSRIGEEPGTYSWLEGKRKSESKRAD